MRSRTQLLIGLGLLAVILGAFLLYQSWPLLTGETVVLATRPVDPFDPLRGQYIIINYEVSRIPAPQGAQEGDTVYVRLAPDESGIWRSQGVSLTRPDGVFLAGTIDAISGDSAVARYGIEQYFFERNAELPLSNLTVRVKISSGGRAKIDELLADGKPMEIRYRDVTIDS